jgi:hypothetical protein
MTDREMALGLGDYINRKLTWIAALESIINRNQIPQWREDAERVVHEQPLSPHISDAHIHHLQYAIPDGTPESELIRALYCHFVGE